MYRMNESLDQRPMIWITWSCTPLSESADAPPIRKECVFRSGWFGNAARSKATISLRVRKLPFLKTKSGPVDGWRMKMKWDMAETGHRGDGSVKRWMDTPLPNWSDLDNGRRKEACE